MEEFISNSIGREIPKNFARFTNFYLVVPLKIKLYAYNLCNLRFEYSIGTEDLNFINGIAGWRLLLLLLFFISPHQSTRDCQKSNLRYKIKHVCIYLFMYGGMYVFSSTYVNSNLMMRIFTERNFI